MKSLQIGRLLVATLAAGLVSAAATGAPARPAASPAARVAPTRSTPEKATFAGGCFWCEEATFEGLPGVVSVVSGYTGGAGLHPTYEQVSAGGTGHAESVEITFDPTKTSYESLLDVFWRNIDPTQAEGQFCDHGRQYRSAIFYHDAGQQRLAEASKRRLATTPQRWKGPIVTEIAPAGPFYPAEDYHQDYYRKNPERYHEYRLGCGRDRRLEQLWGQPAAGAAH